jgi:C1A family cysteine protease
MTVTQRGHYLGRKPDSHDPRDRHFLASHPAAASIQLPPSVDLRKRLPPCFDQGELSSCGPNAGAALMCFHFPEIGVDSFSRLQIYYDVREMEGDVAADDGVETRDVLKALATTGAAPESMWPYAPKALTKRPPAAVYEAASKYKLSSYSRLMSGSNYLQCLASGQPFVMGIELHESFDGDRIDQTGIMVPPGPREQIIGGHDVLVVGYVLNFKSDPLCKQSGVDPALVSDEMLMVRNSWGTNWSRRFRGHFFMPLAYALDQATGNDAWTGRP